MQKITFLGPIGATFSHVAYGTLAEIYGAPKVSTDPAEVDYNPASSNGEVLGMIQKHGGYGAIAMETRAEGRVAEPLESFIGLLKTHKEVGNHSLCVVGAIRMKIHFCLMARHTTAVGSIKKIIAHPKAQGACKGKIAAIGAEFVGAASNGEAARLVAESEEYGSCAALGPRSAASKYGLAVIDEAFEDTEAVTTFFLVATEGHQVSVSKENRLLVVFKVPHKPGAIVHALLPFAEGGLNLIQVHSVHTGNHTYNFAIEIEVGEHELLAAERAMKKFGVYVDEYLSFGPFEVLSR